MAFFHHLLDAGGVDPPVGDELFERHAGDLAPQGVEGGEDDRFRGVVDDQVDPGQGLKSPDVPALAPDDAALHRVRGDGNHADRELARGFRGLALDGLGQDLGGALFGLEADLFHRGLDLERPFFLEFSLELDEQAPLGLLAGETGHPLELELDLPLPLCQGVLPGFEGLFPFGELFLEFIEAQRPGIQLLAASRQALVELFELFPLPANLLPGRLQPLAVPAELFAFAFEVFPLSFELGQDPFAFALDRVAKPLPLPFELGLEPRALFAQPGFDLG